MPGTIYLCGNALNVTEQVKVDDKVIIVVDSANSPQGIWHGRLVSVDEIFKATEKKGLWWGQCEAYIIDDKAGGYKDSTPHLNYQVYPVSAGALHFWNRLQATEQELAGVKRNLEVERRTYQGIFAAMASGDAHTRLMDAIRELSAFMKKK